MYILLIIWILFLLVFLIFNIYGVYRVWSMRIKGDRAGIVITVYLIALFVVIAVSIIFISRLDWGINPVRGIFGNV